MILPLLASGHIHLSAVARLAAHLTDDNADALLVRAAGRSRRDVEELVAELSPGPDVPSFIRRVPIAPLQVAAEQLCPDGAQAAGTFTPAPQPSPTLVPPAVLVPIAPARFKVQFTASSEREGKLARARALLRHQIPSGDLAAIIERALTMLVAELERSKCASTQMARSSLADARVTPSSRHIPAPVRREVWKRDGAQCTFVDAQGRRCPARDALEFHHEVPFARGGDHGPDNVRLLCKSHNAYRAELDFGPDHVRRRVEASRSAARSS